MSKNKFYTCTAKNPKTVITVPGSISINLKDDEVWDWLAKREIAIDNYTRKFSEAIAAGTLRLATSEELTSASVNFSDMDILSQRFWFNTTAMEGEQKIVTRNFQFPDLTTSVSATDFEAMQKLTGFKNPYLVYTFGKLTVHVALIPIQEG